MGMSPDGGGDAPTCEVGGMLSWCIALPSWRKRIQAMLPRYWGSLGFWDWFDRGRFLHLQGRDRHLGFYEPCQ
jgi:hypothetical protein